ncbi:MAG TPA: hypothetical protein PLS00_06600, partial [Niabella sp.]|nr:hypothetical protein [Niabella sp.]
KVAIFLSGYVGLKIAGNGSGLAAALEFHILSAGNRSPIANPKPKISTKAEQRTSRRNQS